MSVQLGSKNCDLKSIIAQSGLKFLGKALDNRPGVPTDKTFVKQSQYHVNMRNFDAAIYYVGKALEYNPDSIVSV